MNPTINTPASATLSFPNTIEYREKKSTLPESTEKLKQVPFPRNASDSNLVNKKNFTERFKQLQAESDVKDKLIVDLEAEIQCLQNEIKSLLAEKTTLLFENCVNINIEKKGSKQNLEVVIKPTANDLSMTLQLLEPIKEELKVLGEKINHLRDKAQKTCELISSGQANAINLKTLLQTYDDELDNLNSTYIDLNPRLEEALKSLDETIKKATHKPIPEEHIKAFSAKNVVSLKEIEENEKNFERLLNQLQDAQSELTIELRHMRRRYEDTTGHLNAIDHNLGLGNSESYLTIIPLSTLFVNWKQKTRISPTSPNYVVDKA